MPLNSPHRHPLLSFPSFVFSLFFFFFVSSPKRRHDRHRSQNGKGMEGQALSCRRFAKQRQCNQSRAAPNHARANSGGNQSLATRLLHYCVLLLGRLGIHLRHSSLLVFFLSAQFFVWATMGCEGCDGKKAKKEAKRAKKAARKAEKKKEREQFICAISDIAAQLRLLNVSVAEVRAALAGMNLSLFFFSRCSFSWGQRNGLK